MFKAIVLSTTGAPRQELLAFLTSVAGLKLLLGDGACIPAAETPELIILDAGARKIDPTTQLRQLKARLPDALCIVLVNSQWQCKAAWDAGADCVLLTGFSALEFRQALERLAD